MQVFTNIQTQKKVSTYLQRVLDSGHVTHAYLLADASEDELLTIAQDFAAGLISDGSREQFNLAMRDAHPDLHLYKPASASGYLVGQIREIVHDAQLAPIRAPYKVYLITQADKLYAASANALLKTLEEPPKDLVCLLLAIRAQAVLETLRSRCEILSCVSLEQERFDFPLVFDALYALGTGATNRQIFDYACQLVDACKKQSEDTGEDYAAKLKVNKEFLSPQALRDLEKQHKREVSAKERDAYLAAISAACSFLRDCLLVSCSADELVAHSAYASQSAKLGRQSNSAALLRALEAAKHAREYISYNVGAQLVFEAMFIEIREALCPR